MELGLAAFVFSALEWLGELHYGNGNRYTISLQVWKQDISGYLLNF